MQETLESRLGLTRASKRWDITTRAGHNNIGGRQGWAYICNSHEIPVLSADADLPQEFSDYKEFKTVSVKYNWRGKESVKYGTLSWESGKWRIHGSSCCISASFGMSDILELINNAQAPVIEKDQIVAVTYFSSKNSLASILLFRVGSVDSLSTVICDLIPLTDEEMKTVVEAAERWCDR